MSLIVLLSGLATFLRVCSIPCSSGFTTLFAVCLLVNFALFGVADDATTAFYHSLGDVPAPARNPCEIALQAKGFGFSPAVSVDYFVVEVGNSVVSFVVVEMFEPACWPCSVVMEPAHHAGAVVAAVNANSRCVDDVSG
jgi:hypothetical protein